MRSAPAAAKQAAAEGDSSSAARRQLGSGCWRPPARAAATRPAASSSGPCSSGPCHGSSRQRLPAAGTTGSHTRTPRTCGLGIALPLSYSLISCGFSLIICASCACRAGGEAGRAAAGSTSTGGWGSQAGAAAAATAENGWWHAAHAVGSSSEAAARQQQPPQGPTSASQAGGPPRRACARAKLQPPHLRQLLGQPRRLDLLLQLAAHALVLKCLRVVLQLDCGGRAGRAGRGGEGRRSGPL